MAGVGFLRYCLQPLLSQICALNHFFRGQLLLLERQLECYCYRKTGTMDGVLQGCLAVQLVTCYFVFVRHSNEVSHTCQLEVRDRQSIFPTVCTVEQKVPPPSLFIPSEIMQLCNNYGSSFCLSCSVLFYLILYFLSLLPYLSPSFLIF